MASVLDNIRKSLNLLSKNKVNFVFSYVSDFLFIVIFGVVFTSIQLRIMGYLYNMVNIVQADMVQLSQFMSDKSVAVDFLLQQPEFAYNLAEAFRWLAILMVVTYLIYGFFQGLAWMYTMKVVDRKWNAVFTYLTRFFCVNLVWVSLFYAFIYTWVKLSVYATFSMFPVISQDMVTGLFISSTLALGYFALVSYPLVKTTNLNQILQKTLLFGITHYRRLLVMFLLVILVMIGVALVYFFFLSGNFLVFLIVSLFIVLPLVTVVRIFVSLTVLGRG